MQSDKVEHSLPDRWSTLHFNPVRDTIGSASHILVKNMWRIGSKWFLSDGACHPIPRLNNLLGTPCFFGRMVVGLVITERASGPLPINIQ
jgi:hypothetical protein